MVIVVLAVVEHDGKFLLIQESKEEIRGKWNLPGGRVEPGESLIGALEREVREEAGLEVSLNGLLYIDQFLSEGPNKSNRLRFVFRAVPRTQSLKSVPDEHSLGARWFTASELRSLNVRNLLVKRMIEVATAAPALPISSVRVLSQHEYDLDS